MSQKKDASVARQATFDTDPDRAKIKRGTLKLPVIQTDDTYKQIDTNTKTGDKKTVASKGKLRDSTEKLRESQTVKHSKDSVNGKRISASENHKTDSKTPKVNVIGKHVSASENHKTEPKTAKPETTDTHISEKQKKLNALNKNHKTSGSAVTEKESKDKEENVKASVLKGVNSKRSKSPEKKQTSHDSQEKSEKENPKEKKPIIQRTPVKSDKEVENKSVQNKTSKDHNEPTDSVSKANKSPRKRDVVENKTVQIKENKNNKEPADSGLKESKNTNKRDQSPRKDAAKTETKKLDKVSPKGERDSKDTHTAYNKVSSTSPRKKAVRDSSTDDHKGKEQSQKDTSVTSAEEHKHNTLDTKSPYKRNKSPQKLHSKSTDSAVLETHKSKQLVSSDTISSTASKTPKETHVTERGRSPEKKVSSVKKGDNDKTKQPAISDIENNSVEQSISVKDENKSSSTADQLLPTNSAPAETKLSDSKRTVVKDSNDKSENSREGNEVELTTAFAFLVTEGSNQVNDTLDKTNTKATLKTPSPGTQNTEIKTTEGENVHNDNLSELKEPDSSRFERHEHSEKSKDTVRQTYVVTPSPTKLEKGNLAKSPSANISELLVESIEIEAKPKGQKMQERESYEQVYAERNTLLKAEYTFRKRIKQLEEEANGFLKTIEDLSSENRLLRDRVDLLEDDMRSRGDRNAHEQISQLENDKDKLEGRIKQLEHLASSNANTKEDSEAIQKETRELKAQVIKLQTENQTTNEENIKLKSENYETVKKLHASEAEAKSLATSVTAVESEKLDTIQDLKKEHSRFKKENAALQKKTGELGKKVESLEFENTSLSESLAEKQKEIKEILGVMKDENKFENEIKDLKNQVLKLQKEKKAMEATHAKEYGTATKSLEDLKTKFDNRSKEFDELKIKTDEMEKEYKSLKKENSAFTKIKQSQEDEITSLNAEIDRLKQALKELRDKSKSDTSDLKKSKENAEELNTDLQKIVTDKENQITKLISQLDAAKKDKENETISLHSDNERLKEENERLQNLETNLDRTESEFKHVVAKLEDAELKKKQLSIQMQDKGFEISNLEQQVFELNMKLDSSSRRVSHLDKEKRELEEDRREWEVKKEKLNDIEASNKRLTEENKRLRGQLEVGSYSDTNRHVVEAWVSDSSSKPSQQATYVQKDKKKVQIIPHPTNFRRRANVSKSSPVKSQTKPVVHHKSEPAKNSVRASRSLEDLRGSPNIKSPESEPSLPELQKETRLTTYGGSNGYSQIHRNRVKALHNKRVY